MAVPGEIHHADRCHHRVFKCIGNYQSVSSFLPFIDRFGSVSHIERNALVHYSSAEMFQLVNDIDSYASFLPWCRTSTVLEDAGDEMTASVEIAKGALNKTFTTHNTLQLDRRIDMALVDGRSNNCRDTGYSKR